MPIYEYECKKCNSVYEMLRSMNADDNDIVCPECGAKKKANKLISSFSSSSESSLGGGACSNASTCGNAGFT